MISTRASGARSSLSDTIGSLMSNAPDPRVLFAAERTLLAWQRRGRGIEYRLSPLRQELAEPGRIVRVPDRSGLSHQCNRRRGGNRVGGLSARGRPAWRLKERSRPSVA